MNNDTWECSEIGFKIPELKRLTYFLEMYCDEEIIELISKYPKKKNIYIKLTDVLRFSSGLEQAIINHYDSIVPILQEAFANVRHVKHSNQVIFKDKVEFHVCNVPAMYRKSIRELNKNDINKLVCVDGFAKSVTDTKPRVTKAIFQCLRCGHINIVEQNNGLKCEEPFAGCENDTCGKKGPFKLIVDDSEFVDFQRIQLHESPDSARGTKTYDILVECSNELTRIVDPGDRIIVTGILRTRQIEGKDGKSTLFQKIIEPLAIEKQGLGFEDIVLTQSDEDEILELSIDPEIQNKVCRSIAPSIHGYEEEKEAISLLLFSGVRKELPDGTRRRGNINIALIGDPGVAKSQLVGCSADISPRGIFTSGKTVSSAGLTAAVVKDPLSSGWTLEGGAAVMASGGVLAIDEIGQAREEEKSALHEVMEQGRISISKAGIVATLRADCSVLAAGNPKDGYFDRYEPIPKQVGIPPALWSRFDLIFIIFDEPNPNYDAAISDHILRNHYLGGMIQNREHSNNSEILEKVIKQELQGIEAPIPKEMLKKYISYARTRVFPVSTDEAMEHIKEFYISIRKMKLNQNSPVPITVRSLEAAQRLAEASARMRLSNKITKQDAEFATKLIFRSLRDVGLDENGILDANLLNGQQSLNQRDKIRWIKGYLKEDRTEKDILDLMEVSHKVKKEQTQGLIKKLIEKNEIGLDPRGYLKVIR